MGWFHYFYLGGGGGEIILDRLPLAREQSHLATLYRIKLVARLNCKTGKLN